MQQLLQAEEWRLARAREAAGSAPSTPKDAKALLLAAGGCIAGDSQPTTADSEGPHAFVGRSPSGPSTPRCMPGVDAADGAIDQSPWSEPPHGSSPMVAEGALTPLERRALRQGNPSPRGPKPPIPASFALGAGGYGGNAASAPPMSAPTTLEQWRPATANRLDVGCQEPRASSSKSPSRPAPDGSATARLLERMKHRDGSSAAPRAESPLGLGACAADRTGWQARIEARQREAVELEEIETHQRQQTEARSCRRNDALRKVMERQAQRQQDVESLEA